MLVLAVGIFFGVTFQARAQLQLKPAPLLDEKPLPEKPDTLVRIVAESQGLPVVPFEKLPRYGTYWQALNPFGSIMAPMPWLPDDAVQVYEIAPNQFLVDNGQAAAIPRPLRRSKLPPLTPDEFVAKQVKELVSLIDQVQTAQKDAELKAAVEQEFTSGNMMSAGMMRGMSLNGASQPAGMDYGTNLWLEIPAVTNNVAYVILHNVVQGEVYELMSSLALPAAPWNPEQALFTVTNQDWIPPGCRCRTALTHCSFGRATGRALTRTPTACPIGGSGTNSGTSTRRRMVTSTVMGPITLQSIKTAPIRTRSPFLSG